MSIIKWSMVVLALCTLGCPGPKPVNTDADITNADDSVYAGNESLADEVLVGGENLPEPERYEEGLIESRRLDVLDQGRDQGLQLDWDPIYFEFDKADLLDEAKLSLKLYAETLKRYPELQVLLEGHCDSRGTEEYNMALGERRAQAVRRYLQQLGVPAEKLRTISYGELRPLATEENEYAWSKNRRVSFTF